jgi:hypothetical protein
MISIALVNYSMLCLSPLPSQFTPPLTDHITHRCIWWRMSTTCLLSGVHGIDGVESPCRAATYLGVHGAVCLLGSGQRSTVTCARGLAPAARGSCLASSGNLSHFAQNDRKRFCGVPMHLGLRAWQSSLSENYRRGL